MRLKKWVREFQYKCHRKGHFPCLESVRYLNTKKNLKEAWDHCVQPGWIDWLLHSVKGKGHRVISRADIKVEAETGRTIRIPPVFNSYGHAWSAYLATNDSSLKLRRSVCNLMRELVPFPGSP